MFSKIRDLGDQDQRMYELRGLIAGKQGKLVRLREVEEEEETPLRSRGTVTADATPQEAGSQGAGQHEAAGYRGEQGPHLQARPDRQVGGQDLVAVISREVGEQTAEIGKAIDELRSFQVTKSPGREAAGGGHHPGDQDTGQPGTAGAEGRGAHQDSQRWRKGAQNQAKTGRASEVVLLKARLRFRKQALINIKQANLSHREKEGREQDRLTQELLEARAGNETPGSGQRYSKISAPRPRRKIKVWRSLVGVLMLGSYLLGAAAEFCSQGRTELTEGCGQGALRTKAGKNPHGHSSLD